MPSKYCALPVFKSPLIQLPGLVYGPPKGLPLITPIGEPSEKLFRLGLLSINVVVAVTKPLPDTPVAVRVKVPPREKLGSTYQLVPTEPLRVPSLSAALPSGTDQVP